MTERPPGDRRVSGALVVSRPGHLRRLLGVLRAGLYQALAEDEMRAACWVRHVEPMRTTAVVARLQAWTTARLDGGSSSPLDALFFSP